jgi:hypothetical protein
MRTGGKTALTVREACLAAGLAFCLIPANAEVPVQVSIDDAAVTIRARNASIRSVLEELSAQTDLTVVSQEPLDELVIVDIDEPTLPRAVHRLLRQKSFMLHQFSEVRDKGNPGTTAVSRLWILAEGGNGNQEAWVTRPQRERDPDASADLIAFQLMVASDKGSDRAEAMYGFGETGGRDAVVFLQQALSDPEERVRLAAMEALAELRGEASVQALSSALNEPDVGMRIDVVDALGKIGGHEAVRYLQVAMTDESPAVREAAAEWLMELAWRRD